ncbi:MAG: SMC family ATPase [Nitrososphaeraceae archaeon]|nr:SMC family ATPase [Nitrososphaeraceae archaeon]MDW0332002.1 SMC family ATPase [Nitrososphaeraceae archaeon]
MVNFISHNTTLLTFNRGITIFVGHNGSGKSSAIDAITFALFGQHTRKTNKNLVRRGTESSSLNVRFSVGSKEYNAHRHLGNNGQSLLAKFDQVSDSGNIVDRTVVSGERKQFGDSMSGEIAKTLGIDYKKLKVGAIVQQGELSSIIESQPKEFKELLNSLIGIDRLDFAYQTMYEVVDSFRERLRDTNGGFDDKQIVSIRLAIEQKRAELKDSESRLTRLEDHRDELNNLLRDTESEIERMEPLILQGRELQATEESLIRYLNGRRACIVQEIRRLEWLIKEAHESYQIISEKEEVIINLHMIRTEIEDLENVIVQDEGENGRLRGLLECAKRMEIKDGGKCPVCGSLVPIKINKLFDAVTIQLEIKQKMINREKMLAEKVCLKREEKIMEAREKRIESAEGFLASNCINVQQNVINLESQLECTKYDLIKIPEILIKINNPRELEIDNFSKSLIDKITELRENIEGLKMQEYTDSKLRRTRFSNQLVDINTKIGGIQIVIEECKKTIKTSNKILLELESAVGLLDDVENIRQRVFSRDGPVALSLRSWALKVLSIKASEYLSMFSIGISRIDLAEKARDVQIVCYGTSGDIDMDSLSGGEKVAVALALRLAIAQMMSSNKLDFIILDEPTIHLDEERRKSLVRIISDSFKEGLGPLSQIIIITHDAEIFEDSEVDRIYRFTMSANGSVVISE